MKAGRSTLGWHFSLLLAASLILMLALCLTVWHDALEAQRAQLRESRFHFSLGSMKGTLESALQLGLATADIPGAQALIEQTHARGPDVLSVDIFDTQGRILFTTDRAGVGAQVPSAWLGPCLASPEQFWRTRTDDSHLQCAALLNGFEKVTGGVALRYKLPERAGTLDALAAHWIEALLLLMVLGGAGSLAGWWLLRPTEQALARQGQASAPAAQDDAWVGPLAAALAALGQREADLEAVAREADAIDALELR